MGTSVSASRQYFQGGIRDFPVGDSTQTITFPHRFNKTPTLVSITPLVISVGAGLSIQSVDESKMVVNVLNALSSSSFYWMAGVSL